MNEPTYAEMDLLEELGDEIHIKAEDLSDFEDETQIEAVFFPNSLLNELKDENQMEAEVFSTSDTEMEGNASTQEGLETLSDKSYNRYFHAYEAFKNWQESKEVNSITEPVLLDYFRESSEKYKPSTLYMMYSMLKSTILRNHSINISVYRQLIEFLKEKAEKSSRFTTEKSKLFTADDINKFLVEAPDDKYLAMKVVLVFGVLGAISTESITNVMTDHVTDNGNEIMLRIFHTRTKIAKAHVIGGQFAAIVRKYMKVRPRPACTERFFIQYRDGKCINQVIGKKTISKVPKEIAKFLKLPEFEAYTAYSFRITSTPISADTSVAIETRHGPWKSGKIVEENVQESLGHDRKIISEELNFTSTSNVIIASHESALVRIPPVTITSSELPSHVYEVISDESTDIPENNSLFENEDTSTQDGLETLPDKSYIRYLNAYEAFKKWQESKEVNSYAEPVLLDYFRESSEKYKPSTLYMMYSMLKSTILRNHSINISVYSQLIEFLKEKANGFRSKKSKMFTAEDVNKFLSEAPDDEYLAMKTVSVFVVLGANSTESITNVMTDQVTDNGNEIIARIPHAKTKIAKAHVIRGQFAEIVRKYMKLRPGIACTERFFIQYRSGKCINQAMSRTYVGRMPKEIAIFLKLPESEAYSFRSTSKTISADTGVAIESLKRHGRQKCNRVPEGNVDESLCHKIKIESLIAEGITLPSTSNVDMHENESKRIATFPVTSSESSSLVLEISDEYTGNIPENNSLSENEDASTQDGLETLPDKSYIRYLNAYEAFKKWQESKEVNSVTELVLLDYFRESSEKYKPSTLYMMYSMLKSTILRNHSIDISVYSQLIEFLKKKADGFRSKKSKIFTAEDVHKFLAEAMDYEYLAMKTVSVFALIGECSLESLTYVETDYVKDTGSEIIARIPHQRSKIVKAHVIDVQFADIVRKYMKLRPRTALTNSFFIQYRGGKCINQPIGKNAIAKVPKIIAKFLKLPESEEYNGFSFRITPNNTNVALETLKRLGLRRSGRVDEGNVQVSLGHKRKIDSLIAEEISFPSTSNVVMHQNESRKIATVTIVSSESSSLVHEISNESIGDMPEDDSLSENEVENFRNPPTLSYFKISDASMREVLHETLAIKKSDTSTQEALETSSVNTYVYIYEMFKKWQDSKELNSFAEPMLLDYFRELSTKYRPSSLWNLYAMLKCTILSNHNVNISGYSQLIEFLKEKSDGFQRNMAKVFTDDDVTKFLVKAPNDEYLAMKVVLVFALIGACSGEKIMNVMTDHVKDNGSEIIVRIPDAKTNLAKSHIIDGQFAELVRKYMKLRPRTACTQRFFVQYQNGKCMDQEMGRNNIAKVPKEIAKFLKLPESDTYTRYSFRSTSTRSSTDTGVAIETLTQHEQQRCSRASKEYVESSGSRRNVITASHKSASERISLVTISGFESSLVKEEIIDESPSDMSDNNSSSESEESSDSNDDTGLNRNHRIKEPKRERQKEIDWYDEECLAQIKLTTDMFKRFSKMAEIDKMKMLSDFSMDRVELFKKYFAAMNTVTRNPINTATTASINTAAQNGSVTDPDGILP